MWKAKRKNVKEMSVKCPRCGEEMTGGICDNCGFPLTKMRKRINNGDVPPGCKLTAGRAIGKWIH